MTLAALAAGTETSGASACLALNEPWWSPPLSVRAAARAAAEHLHRYPSGADDQRLAARLAAHHGVAPEEIVVGAGAAGLLRDVLLALCLPHRRRDVVFAAPGFDLFGMLPGQLDGTAVPVPLTAAGDQDLEAMLRACGERTAAVVVCNPHNPTGTGIRAAALRSFLAAVPEHVTVLLDEAYCAYVTDPAVPVGPLEARGSCRGDLAILRSFSKSHALGGARVGYLVAPPSLAAAVRARVLPFSVSRFAHATAFAALDAAAAGQYATAWADVAAARAELRTALLVLGYAVPPSHANFVWLDLGARAAEFAEHCAYRGVLVRAYPGLGVRVTVGSPVETATFLAAAGSFQQRRAA